MEERMHKLIMLVGVLLLLGCSANNPVSDNSGSAPDGHTVNKSGVMHRPGLTNPTENCVSCHGSDLKGGTVGVSCYSCHGKKW